MIRLPILLALFMTLANGDEGFQGNLNTLNIKPAALDPGSVSPYINSIDEDLTAVFAKELLAAKQRLDPKLSKQEKNRQLHLWAEGENRKVRTLLQKSSESGSTPISKELMQRIFDSVRSNKAVKAENSEKYDKWGDMGFCFGRAALVHYLLLTNAVEQNRIAKIFAVGDLFYANSLWHFHIATMVKGEKGIWWVIDNLFEKPLTQSEWIERATGFDIKKTLPQLRFYVTDPRKFQPAYGRYRLEEFNLPELNRYFRDLFPPSRSLPQTKQF